MCTTGPKFPWKITPLRKTRTGDERKRQANVPPIRPIIIGQLTDHAYDGIREYDNPLPGWWSWLFILCIIFSILYFVIATTTGQLSAVYAYQQSVVEETAKEFGTMNVKPDAATLLMLGKDPRFHALGRKYFPDQLRFLPRPPCRGHGLPQPHG